MTKICSVYSYLGITFIKGGSSAVHTPPFENFYGCIFGNFDYITLYCNLHAMYTICILFSPVTTKAKGMCAGASKQSSDLKNYTATGPRPPVLKLDPPLFIIV